METQNVISNDGRKWIKYFIIGLFLLSGFCFVSYRIAYDSAKEYYYGQLENLIIDRYLEGNESFGIYLYTDGKTTLNYPGKYTEDWNLYLKYPHMYKPMPSWCDGFVNRCPEGTFDNRNILNILSDETKYKWWAGTDFLKCMIVKRTSKGFDFINERMIGIGFNFIWFPSDVEVEKSEWPFGDRKIKQENLILKNLSLCNQYVNNLLSSKYNDVPIRMDINDRKYNMLMELRQKTVPIPVTQSPYFNNQYFELRPNYKYLYRGGGVTTQTISRFGNEYNDLYVSTVTTHYSIQECGNELKKIILEIVISIFAFIVIIYGAFCIFKYKQEKSQL